MPIRTYGDSIMDNALCRIPLYTKNRGSNPRLPIRCNFLREISKGKNVPNLQIRNVSHMQLQKHTKTQWKRWKEVTNMIILYTLLICFIGKDSENENAI